MKIFEYKRSDQWSKVILKLMKDLIDDRVVRSLKKNPPKYFVRDDSAWLDKALTDSNKTFSQDTFSILSDRLLAYYSKIRVFHACRPDNLDSYYQEGFHPLNPGEYLEKARKLFLKPEFPEINIDLINNAIKRVGTETRDGYVYFSLDDEFMIGHCGHYLIHGSEYLMSITVELGGKVGQDLRGYTVFS